MEIQVKKKPAEFQPIEVVITITSEAELEGLREMCLYNVSIPDLVARSAGPPAADAAKLFLSSLERLL